MDAAGIALALASLKPQLTLLGVRKLLLVGSALKGELGPESDVDFVVEFEGPARFIAYMDLIDLLEDAVGRPVDLTTMSALRPEIATEVLAGTRQVA